MSLNKVMLIGRLGGNPEVRFTPGGAAVGNFNIATNEVWNDKNGQKQERTEWHRIVVWGKQAQTCADYLTKGRQVYVEGRMQTRQWQDKEGQTRYTTEVVANNIQFLGAGGDKAGASYGGATASAGGSSAGMAFGGGNGSSAKAEDGGPVRMEEPSFADEDIPF